MIQPIPVSIVTLFGGGLFIGMLQENDQISAPVAMILGGLLIWLTIRIARKEEA